jgi:nucleolar protein 56
MVFDREKFLKKAADQLSEEIASPDYIIIQTINSIEDLNKIANLCSERLREWYSIHFPEFKSKDPKKYAQVASFFDRKNPNKEKLFELFGQEAEQILHLSYNSIGVIFDKEDMEALQSFASFTLKVYNQKEELENYLKKITKKHAPNLSSFCGEFIAAKLIQKAGGLKKLAQMPSSTIQVLGAEKALFKHLKSGTPSPKHGIIFQHPLISGNKKEFRGKIARKFASKIAILSKADAFSKNLIVDQIKKKFENQIKKILEKSK